MFPPFYCIFPSVCLFRQHTDKTIISHHTKSNKYTQTTRSWINLLLSQWSVPYPHITTYPGYILDRLPILCRANTWRQTVTHVSMFFTLTGNLDSKMSLHVFGVSGETRAPRGNTWRHRENNVNPTKKRLGANPDPFFLWGDSAKDFTTTPCGVNIPYYSTEFMCQWRSKWTCTLYCRNFHCFTIISVIVSTFPLSGTFSGIDHEHSDRERGLWMVCV